MHSSIRPISHGREQVLEKRSRVLFKQPILDHQNWFLTAPEMRIARGGFDRQQQELFTTGNRVKLYAASSEYFSDVADDIEDVHEDDFVYITGWTMCNVPFKPQELESEKTTLHRLVEGAVTRGADVRMLVWSNLIERKQVLEVRDFVNALPPPKAKGPARFVFDDRLPHSASSHHQKSVIIRKGCELVAYVGGVDLTSNRWDTIEHDQYELRHRAGLDDKGYKGWVDAHARINGPAAMDVVTNFLERWNSKPKPSQDLLDDLLAFENPDFSDLPLIKEEIPEDGSHAVQLVRTYSPKCHDYDFAPKGEHSILHARIKAITKARNYVFIQDQYFILVPELQKILLKKLPTITRLIVIVQKTAEAKYVGYNRLLHQMVDPLQLNFPDKFKLYTIKEERELYVHSKLVIVDDVYVSLGSANWNCRSMTSDTEIGINIVDSEVIDCPDNIKVNKLARDFRVQKFMEATKVPYEKIDGMTFLEACDALEAAASDKGFSLIQPYRLENNRLTDGIDHLPHTLVDPYDALGEWFCVNPWHALLRRINEAWQWLKGLCPSKDRFSHVAKFLWCGLQREHAYDALSKAD